MPLLIVAAGIVLLLLLILCRINAFIALILVSLGVGLAEGMALKDVIASVQNGIGSTLGQLALILGFGAMLGKLVAESGAAQRISSGLTNSFGIKRIHWAILITGFVVGLPMFYTAGFVILIPLVFTIAASANIPLLYVGIPMAASLSVTHGFLPPHPGPTAIAVIFKADVALTLLYGFIISIPTIIVAGPVFSHFVKNIKSEPLPKFYNPKVLTEQEMPGFANSLITALIPVLLMMVASVLILVLPEKSQLRTVFSFLGDPVISLLLAVLVAVYTLGIGRGKKMNEVMDCITDSVTSIGMILLIIGGGGAFKQVLVDSGVGKYLASMLSGSAYSPLFLAWGIAAALRVALGSATVAALTSAGIVLPLIETTGASRELMVLATGAGSLMFSHVNDAGFWIFKEYFNLSILQTICSWSIMETIVSVMGLLGVLVINMFI